MSTQPGVTSSPLASNSLVPGPRFTPTAATHHAVMATSLTRPGAPLPSITVPLRITMSYIGSPHSLSKLCTKDSSIFQSLIIHSDRSVYSNLIDAAQKILANHRAAWISGIAVPASHNDWALTNGTAAAFQTSPALPA